MPLGAVFFKQKNSYQSLRRRWQRWQEENKVSVGVAPPLAPILVRYQDKPVLCLILEETNSEIYIRDSFYFYLFIFFFFYFFLNLTSTGNAGGKDLKLKFVVDYH